MILSYLVISYVVFYGCIFCLALLLEGPNKQGPFGKLLVSLPDTGKYEPLILVYLLFLPFLFLFAYTRAAFQSFLPVFVFLTNSLQGVFGMKWKLIKFVLVSALGYGACETKMVSKVYEWYNAPPTPPSAEAQKLIVSLERADGWKSYTSGSGHTCVKKMETTVASGSFFASVWAGDAKCDGQFSGSDLKAINKAAATCLRKLATKAMNESVADSR